VLISDVEKKRQTIKGRDWHSKTGALGEGGRGGEDSTKFSMGGTAKKGTAGNK